MFEFHQPNLESMQQYLNQESEKSTGEGPNWWNIPAGMSSVRILPPWDPTGRIALPVYMHPIEYKGKDMSYTKYNWTCVGKTFNKKCNICEGLQELSAAGVDISNYEASRRQFYFNAIVMHDPTYDAKKDSGTAPGTHVLMKAPKTFYDWVISQITNPMVGDISSVTNGIDVYITKEGKGLGTTYNMTLSPNGRTAVPQEYLDKIDSLYNLDDIFSTGFDTEQVNELVNHLRNSAGVITQSVGNVVNNMAGYMPTQQTIQGGYTNSTPTAPNPYQYAPNPTQQPVIPQGITIVNEPVGTPPITETDNVTMASSTPKCFGNYDAGAVNCVVCPVEVNCSQSSK